MMKNKRSLLLQWWLLASSCFVAPLTAIAQNAPAPLMSAPVPPPLIPQRASPESAPNPSASTPAPTMSSTAVPESLPNVAQTPKLKPKSRPAPQPHEMALSDDPMPVLQPETFFTTAKASERCAVASEVQCLGRARVGPISGG